MRIESTATTLSWIPSHSILSSTRHAFALGVSHWDHPLPDRVSAADVDELVRRDRVRFGNVLAGWAEVEDGRIIDAGFSDGAGVRMGSTTVRLGTLGATFAAIALPVLRADPVIAADGSTVHLRQTVGGRTAIPVPRPVPRPPFVQWAAPLVWTTIELTIDAEGGAQARLAGASPFPRHWLYAPDGALAAKNGLTDERGWLDRSFGSRTPWGASDSPALVAEVESAVERRLSAELMRGSRPEVRVLAAGAELTRQGEPGSELYLLLDGILAVEVDGEPVGEVGPGAILGERAILESGRRTATLRARTPIRVAVAPAGSVDRDALSELAARHHREDDAEIRSADAV